MAPWMDPHQPNQDAADAAADAAPFAAGDQSDETVRLGQVAYL